MYLKGKMQVLDRKVGIAKSKTNKSAPVAAKAQKDPNIAKRQAKELTSVVSKLQRRLDRLEGLGSAGCDVLPPKFGWKDNGPGPTSGPGTPRARARAD